MSGVFHRENNRKVHELRPIKITNHFLEFARGSVLIEMGNTKVICTASVDDGVPDFLKNSGRGWLTAEYSMLPAATPSRNERESTKGKTSGRTQEIQRIIGRSLRAVTDMTLYGERTIHIDCDVIQADGGTRTASVTGAFIALVDAFRSMIREGLICSMPVSDYVAAVSVGYVNRTVLLDLDYREDSIASVDMNYVATRSGMFIEVQGTAESAPFNRDILNEMTDLSLKGIASLTKKQIDILGDAL
jgi:ribonuclease PH